jgi:prepilin-type N-terminal cleavage/methylation domain-containing protein
MPAAMVDVNARQEATLCVRIARRQRRASCGARRRAAAFSLIELLAVIAIIAVMSGLVGYLLRGSGTESRGLQTAQSTVASLLTLARSQAAVSGRDAALFVRDSSSDPDHMRHLLVAVKTNGQWEEVNQGVRLAAGCYIVPYSAMDGSMVDDPSELSVWNSKRSSVLFRAPDAGELPATLSGGWRMVVFSEFGTIKGSGDIVLATGRANASPTAPFFVYTNPDNVRGVSVSQYGQLTMLNNRRDL